MKGQISIDYYIALIIFIFFVVYFLFQISNLVPNFLGQMEEQRMRSEAYQISELLVNDIGSPPDWNTLVPDKTAQIKRIGLSDQTRNKTNLLSSPKIKALDGICLNETLGQHFLRSAIDTDLQFSVFLINKSSGGAEFSCQPAASNLRGFSVITKRVVAFDNGNFGELTLQLWRP